MTGYSSVSSMVVFCHSKACGVVPVDRGIFINRARQDGTRGHGTRVVRITIFGQGSGHAVCGIICHSNGTKGCCVGHFGIASIAHKHRCSLSRNSLCSEIICFATGPGKRTRIIGIALGPTPGIGGVFFSGSFDRITVGNHRDVNGLLDGGRIRHVKLGSRKKSALNKQGI